MAIKKRWIEAVEDAAAQETVRLPWTRGVRRMAVALARHTEETSDGAPA